MVTLADYHYILIEMRAALYGIKRLSRGLTQAPYQVKYDESVSRLLSFRGYNSPNIVRVPQRRVQSGEH